MESVHQSSLDALIGERHTNQLYENVQCTLTAKSIFIYWATHNVANFVTQATVLSPRYDSLVVPTLIRNFFGNPARSVVPLPQPPLTTPVPPHIPCHSTRRTAMSRLGFPQHTKKHRVTSQDKYAAKSSAASAKAPLHPAISNLTVQQRDNGYLAHRFPNYANFKMPRFLIYFPIAQLVHHII